MIDGFLNYGASDTDFKGPGMPRKTGRLISMPLPEHANRVWKVTTEPETEPITVQEVKDFAKLEFEDSTEDSLIEAFIKAVRIAAEDYLNMAFIEQTIQMKMDYWPGIVLYLPRPPLISVTKIVTLDEDDTETEYDSDNYYIITEGRPGKVILKKSVTSPTNTDRDFGGFMIEFKAGYGDSADDVPESLKNGIKAWAAIVQGTRVLDAKNPPPEAKLFFDLYRPARVMVR